MCLEIKDSIAYKCPEKCFGALISDQNEKPHIFHKIDIPEINVQLFEKNFKPYANGSTPG